MRSNVESDDGSSVLTFWMIFLPVMLMLLGASVDFSKNYYIADAYDRAADNAAKAASNVRDSQGRLSGHSIKQFDSEYKTLRSENHTTATFRNSYCDSYQGRSYPVMEAGIAEDRGGRTGDIATVGWAGSSTPADLTVPNTIGIGYSLVGKVQETSGNYILSMFGHPCQVYNINVGTMSISEDGDYTGRGLEW